MCALLAIPRNQRNLAAIDHVERADAAFFRPNVSSGMSMDGIAAFLQSLAQAQTLDRR